MKNKKLMKMCGSENYPHLPHGRDLSLDSPPLWKFQSSFIYISLNFWAFENPHPKEFPIPSMGGVWIFSGTTQ